MTGTTGVVAVGPPADPNPLHPLTDGPLAPGSALTESADPFLRHAALGPSARSDRNEDILT